MLGLFLVRDRLDCSRTVSYKRPNQLSAGVLLGKITSLALVRFPLICSQTDVYGKTVASAQPRPKAMAPRKARIRTMVWILRLIVAQQHTLDWQPAAHL